MRRLLLALGAIVFAAGCSSQGIYAVPLPGGADLGDNPMHLQIDFRDVLDLVPQSAVKVDGVPVGRVSDIALAPDGWTATVNALVNDDVDLPANAHAEVAQTNLLGEKFIALSAPPDPSTERLADGAHIPVEDTRSATEIEQVLGALSLLLNGGGVAQLQPIITELNKSLEGRAPEVRSLLEQSDRLVSGLEEQVDSITRALDGLDALSDRVAAQNDQIAAILDELPEGITILNEQRPQLIEMLAQLDRLGQVGYDVVTASRDDLINDLLALRAHPAGARGGGAQPRHRVPADPHLSVPRFDAARRDRRPGEHVAVAGHPDRHHAEQPRRRQAEPGVRAAGRAAGAGESVEPLLQRQRPVSGLADRLAAAVAADHARADRRAGSARRDAGPVGSRGAVRMLKR